MGTDATNGATATGTTAAGGAISGHGAEPTASGFSLGNEAAPGAGWESDALGVDAFAARTHSVATSFGGLQAQPQPGVFDNIWNAARDEVLPPAETGRSLREARYALQVCRVEGRAVADFRSLGTYRLLLTLQEPDALRAFADSVLEALDAYDREQGGELVSSLRAFLDHNARWESAAAELYVHRHTLRYRMRKVEELTGRDLDLPHERMEFWLAIRARELLVPAGE